MVVTYVWNCGWLVFADIRFPDGVTNRYVYNKETGSLRYYGGLEVHPETKEEILFAIFQAMATAEYKVEVC